MTRFSLSIRLAVAFLMVCLASAALRAQLGGLAPAPAATQAAQNEPPKDLLGRDTPRGTVLGFMGSARRGNDEAATMYLDSTLKGQQLADLAHQLYIVLDSRLPARLNELSDRPEGALANPLKPDLDVVGTVNSETGPLDIVVERVTRGTSAPMWLFSRATLEAIPAVYREVDRVTVDRHLPGLFRAIRIGGIRLFEWITLLVIIPAIYRLLGLATWLTRPMILLWRRRSGTPQNAPITVPGWLRLVLVGILIRWTVGLIDLPLLERQFWATNVTLIFITAAVLLLVQFNAYGEYRISRRFHGASLGEVTALLRFGRRIADLLVIAAGVLVALQFFGFNPTAALAGLGIGGIAIALAAQKTLENVIGGLSLVFDKAVKVGDFLKFGDTFGTVDSIGLRSTRIRTLDRTILSVPNGQISTAGIETFSARDMFWFHHYVGLAYSTTPVQMRTVIDSIQKMLSDHPAVDRSSSRARFLRFSPSTLDIEVFAYVYAPGWERFLEIQQEFLLTIMEIVERAGTEIALPSQTLFVADSAGSVPASAATARLIPSRDH
jgi:MscS family membrane protein